MTGTVLAGSPHLPPGWQRKCGRRDDPNGPSPWAPTVSTGGASGPIATRLTGPHLDDFTFIGHSDTLVAALDPDNKVALIQPDGTYRIVLTSQDGLSRPTSAAVRHGRLYVLNAAFLDPPRPQHRGRRY
jgi:hypothetical protein